MDSEKKPENDHSKRDGETLIALGIFITILSIPVFIGTFFEESGLARIVNVSCGLILFGIGAGFLYQGKRTLDKL